MIEEGERGDTFYVVVDGSLEVSSDGRLLRTIGPGDFFGEIALLRDVPRTATVRTLPEFEDAFRGAIAAKEFLLGPRWRPCAVERSSPPDRVSNEVAAVS